MSSEKTSFLTLGQVQNHAQSKVKATGTKAKVKEAKANSKDTLNTKTRSTG